MKKIDVYENVQAATGEYARPTAGGYVVKILDVTDVPVDENGKGDYLRIDYDICEGEFDGYYTEQHKKWGGTYYANFIRSYKEKALGMFKHFMNCVEESNKGFSWDWNEKELIGKKVGIVTREEEYVKNDGTTGTRIAVSAIKTVQQIRDGDFNVLAKKTLPNTATTVPTAKFEEVLTDEDLPF